MTRRRVLESINSNDRVVYRPPNRFGGKNLDQRRFVQVQEKVQHQVHHVSDPLLVQNPFEVYVPVLVGIFSLSEMMKEDVKGLQVVEVVSDGVGQA